MTFPSTLTKDITKMTEVTEPILTKSPRPLPEDGLIRMSEFLRHVPVSRSTAYAKIRAGVWPPPLRVSNRIIAFKVSDVRALIERFERGEA
jgi:predicted DNA-binding transcriptional regulator AlpA